MPEIEYEFIEAESGEEGLEYCRTQDVDCVLLDYALIDLNGLEFLTKFKTDRAKDHTAIPIVLLTNHGNEFIAIEALDEHFETAKGHVRSKWRPEKRKTNLKACIFYFQETL